MRKHIHVTLLVLVVAALVCEIAMHSRPAHAQGPVTVYIDRVPHNFRQAHDELVLKGTMVLGFQCAEGTCYVLSK